MLPWKPRHRPNRRALNRAARELRRADQLADHATKPLRVSVPHLALPERNHCQIDSRLRAGLLPPLFQGLPRAIQFLGAPSPPRPPPGAGLPPAVVPGPARGDSVPGRPVAPAPAPSTRIAEPVTSPADNPVPAPGAFAAPTPPAPTTREPSRDSGKAVTPLPPI